MVSSSSPSRSEAQPSLVRAGRLAAFAWLSLAAGLLVDGAVWSGKAIAGDLRGLDFISFYATSKLILARGPGAMYDLQAQEAIQSQLAAGWGGQPFLPDLYPPFFVLARGWLALLPLPSAYAVWLAIHVGVLMGALVLLTRTAGLAGRPRAAALLAGAGFAPAVVDVWQGQQTAFILLALAGAAALKGNRAGAALAGALIEPNLTLANFLLAFTRPRRNLLFGLLGTGLLLAVVSVALVGPDGAVHYLQQLVGHAGAAGAAVTRYKLGVRGLLAAAGFPEDAQYALLLAGLIAAVGVIRLVPGPPQRDIGAATTASLLLTPHLNFHSLELLLVPGIFLGGELVRRPQSAGWLALGSALIGVTIAAYLAPAAIVGELVLLAYLVFGWRRRGGS